MARTQTKFFGEMEYVEKEVLQFTSGLPGFEEHSRFLPLQQPGYESVVFLQSLVASDLCFVTMPVRAVCPEYRLSASPEDLDSLGFTGENQPSIGGNALCLAILTVSGGNAATANLMAPLLINLHTNQGMQVLQTEAGYSHQHALSDSLERAGC